MQDIFILGGTGYIGTRLIKKLNQANFNITALVRTGSESKVPKGISIVLADVFKPEEWISRVPTQSIIIHLIGVSHPSPSKKKLFETIDLRSIRIIADVAKLTKAKKLIYLSVAMGPSAIMKDFQAIKRKGEAYIETLNIPHIFIRPWYVLGPGHWWPYLLWPLFKFLEILPATAKSAKAFGFVTINQIICSLIFIVNHVDEVPSIIEIEDIKKMEFK